MSDSYWRAPLKWKPGRVFCGSMCDVLEGAPGLDEQRERLWRLIEETPHLTWMLLTKRPENAERFMELETMRRVWFGISAENQNELADRAEYLVAAHEMHSPVVFLSYKPALEPIKLGRWIPAFDWIIVGGESGAGHRPFDPQWARSVRDECQEAGVPFFFKQHGGRTPKSGGKLLDGREWCEVPNA